MKKNRLASILLRAAAAALLSSAALGAGALSRDASQLRGQFEARREAIAASPFGRPLVLDSTESPDRLQGEVYAVVDQPFNVAAGELRERGRWCDLLILQFNVKRCTVEAERLVVLVGRKSEQPAEDAFRMAFEFAPPQSAPDFLRVQLGADEGPLGTRDYRIALEVVPLDARRSFVHLSYGYSYGMAAKLAMQTYLATTGRDKVGFSAEGNGPDGKPAYVKGVRGVAERNAMRYYLAIEAYLGSLSAPPAQRLDKRLNDWFDATERTPRQLHEMDRAEYLALKRRDTAKR